MKRSAVPMTVLCCALLAGPALASFGGGSGSDRSGPSASGASATGGEASPREEAEQLYASAYEQVAQARKDLAGGKAKNAEKRFRQARELGEKAVALDRDYHEAWNLVGFAARKLGDYEKAFEAYEKCLAIKPDYAPAREYLGEAWLEKGDAGRARAQLALLEGYGERATEDARTLRTAIEAYDAAHAATDAADSTGAGK